MSPRALLLLVLAAALVPAAADERFDFGFSEGTEPIALGEGGHKATDPARCGKCHQAEYDDWMGSRHRVAHTNDIYQAGLIAEPRAFCVNCHSPLEAQTAQVIPNLSWYHGQDPRSGGTDAERGPEPAADHGVSCAACHFRDGKVLSVNVSGSAPHASQAVPELASGDFCAGCHEFRMPAFDDGTLTLTDVPMQSTWSEWVAWTADGGKQQCQDCHMPEGRHVFRGAHDREWLVETARVKVKHKQGEATFRLWADDVGHNFPSGDLFRNLTLEVSPDGETWTVVERMGRRFELEFNEELGEVRKELVADTSLRPGEKRTVSVDAEAGSRWRLRYHYGSENDEHRGMLAPDQIVITLREGTL